MNNECLIINAMGLVNGARKKNDGITFFGNNLIQVRG